MNTVKLHEGEAVEVEIVSSVVAVIRYGEDDIVAIEEQILQAMLRETRASIANVLMCIEYGGIEDPGRFSLGELLGE